MRKVDDGEEKEKEKRKRKKREKNEVFSGHYVIASSLPPARLRPHHARWNAARSCQNMDDSGIACLIVLTFKSLLIFSLPEFGSEL